MFRRGPAGCASWFIWVTADVWVVTWVPVLQGVGPVFWVFRLNFPDVMHPSEYFDEDVANILEILYSGPREGGASIQRENLVHVCYIWVRAAVMPPVASALDHASKVVTYCGSRRVGASDVVFWI